MAAGRFTGLDPGARLLFLGSAEDDDDQADLLTWAAGLEARGNMAGLPPPPAPADVFSLSVRRGPLSPKLAAAYRRIALHGRNGRGALLCFAAGNHCEDLPGARPDLPADAFTIGASTRDEAGREVLAPYSARGPGLHLCAPSSPVLGDRVSRLFPYGPVIAGVPRHCGSVAFRALACTTLLAPASAGDRSLRVDNAADFLPGSRASVELEDEVFLLSIFDTRPGRLIVRPCPTALPVGAVVDSGTRRLARITRSRRGNEVSLQLDRRLELQVFPARVLLGGPDQEIGSYEEVEIVEASAQRARLRDALTSWRPHFSLALDETHWAPTGGTSTAAPFVAGVASLLLSRRPDLSREELTQLLIETSRPLEESKQCEGARRVDAGAAILALGRR